MIDFTSEIIWLWFFLSGKVSEYFYISLLCMVCLDVFIFFCFSFPSLSSSFPLISSVTVSLLVIWVFLGIDWLHLSWNSVGSGGMSLLSFPTWIVCVFFTLGQSSYHCGSCWSFLRIILGFIDFFPLLFLIFVLLLFSLIFIIPFLLTLLFFSPFLKREA